MNQISSRKNKKKARTLIVLEAGLYSMAGKKKLWPLDGKRKSSAK